MINAFIFTNLQSKIILQLLLIQMLVAAHIKMQDWIFLPFCLQIGNGKPLEQILATLEITLQGTLTRRDLPKRRGRLRKLYFAGLCTKS